MCGGRCENLATLVRFTVDGKRAWARHFGNVDCRDQACRVDSVDVDSQGRIMALGLISPVGPRHHQLEMRDLSGAVLSRRRADETEGYFPALARWTPDGDLLSGTNDGIRWVGNNFVVTPRSPDANVSGWFEGVPGGRMLGAGPGFGLYQDNGTAIWSYGNDPASFVPSGFVSCSYGPGDQYLAGTQSLISRLGPSQTNDLRSYDANGEVLWESGWPPTGWPYIPEGTPYSGNTGDGEDYINLPLISYWDEIINIHHNGETISAVWRRVGYGAIETVAGEPPEVRLSRVDVSNAYGVAHFQADGTRLWAREIPGWSYANAYRCAVDSQNRTWVIGDTNRLWRYSAQGDIEHDFRIVSRTGDAVQIYDLMVDPEDGVTIGTTSFQKPREWV